MYLNDNLITNMPAYMSYSLRDSFYQIDISQNRLDFSDAYSLETYNNVISYSRSYFYGGMSNDTTYLNYSNQKPFGISDTATVLTYIDTTLTIADQRYADSYQWYHDGVAISGATDTVLHIYCATQADAGIYTCHSIGQYFARHSFRFRYGITEFTSEPKTLIVDPAIGRADLAVLYPTVSSGGVTLKYALPEEQSVSIRIYDMKGSLVSDNSISAMPHGEYVTPLDLSFLAAGAYITKITYSKGYTRTIRLAIMGHP